MLELFVDNLEIISLALVAIVVWMKFRQARKKIGIPQTSQKLKPENPTSTNECDSREIRAWHTNSRVLFILILTATYVLYTYFKHNLNHAEFLADNFEIISLAIMAWFLYLQRRRKRKKEGISQTPRKKDGISQTPQKLTQENPKSDNGSPIWFKVASVISCLLIFSAFVSYSMFKPINLNQASVPMATGILLISTLLYLLFPKSSKATQAKEKRRYYRVEAAILVGCPLAAASIFFLNATYDEGAPQQHVSVIANKYKKLNAGGRGSSSYYKYYVVLPPMKNTKDPIALEIWKAEYDSLIPEMDQYQVTTKPGFFKIEWIVAHQRVQRSLPPLDHKLDLEADIAVREELISASYQWTRVKRQQFIPLSSTALADEKKYLEEVFQLCDRAILGRVSLAKKVAGQQSDPLPEEWQKKTIEQFKAVQAPERLREFHRLMVLALDRHIEFMEQWKTWNQVTEDPRVAQASSNLHQAYDILLKLYPTEPEENKQAFYGHLCALDFL